jgi:hypothetical protein
MILALILILKWLVLLPLWLLVLATQALDRAEAWARRDPKQGDWP